MLLEVLPDVINPLVILQTYFAPLPALVTEAILLPEPAHTAAAAEMVAVGNATMETSLFPEEETQCVLLVTVTESVTDCPAAPVTV